MDAPGTVRYEDDDIVIEGSVGGPYMVEKIVGIYMGKNHKKYYRVKWIDSWEPEENLSEACQALIDDFWKTGKTLDCQGKEVKQTELKSGQKIIKKEVSTPQFQSNGSSAIASDTTASTSPSNPALNDNNTDTRPIITGLKSELLSPRKDTASSVQTPQITVLKNEIASRNGNVSSTTNSTPSTSNADVSASTAYFDHNNAKSTSLAKHGKRPLKSAVPDSSSNKIRTRSSPALQTQSSPAANGLSSNIKKSRQVAPESKEVVQIQDHDVQSETTKPRRSLDEQTQTDMIDDALIHNSSVCNVGSQVISESSHQHHRQKSMEIETATSHVHVTSREVAQNLATASPTTQMKTLHSSRGVCNEHSVSSSGAAPSTPEVIAGDEEAETIKMLPSDQNEPDEIVDIESEGEEENDIEITVSIESPNKRPRHTNPQSRGCNSAPNMRRQGREKTTQRRRNVPDRGRAGSDSSPSSRPLHPRSLLRSFPSTGQASSTNSDVTPRSSTNTQIPTLPDIGRNSVNNILQQQTSREIQQTTLVGASGNIQQIINGGEPQNTQQLNQGEVSSHPTSTTTSKRKTQVTNSPSSSSSSSTVRRNSRTSSSNNGVSSPTSHSSRNQVQRHIIERTCNICNHTFPNLTRARQHMREAHGNIRGDQQQSPQQQNSLASTSSTTGSPTTMASSRNPISDLTCHICFGLFRNNRDLKSHMLLHSDEPNLPKCDICLRTFRSKSTLNQHLLIHSDELPYQCETCGKRFRQQGHLIVHMAQHSQDNEGSFACPYCRQEFANTGALRNHVHTHEAELPFSCNQCQDRFESKLDLVRHLEGHNEGKPYSCLVCKKSFKTKTYLSGHMQLHKSLRQTETRVQNGSSSSENHISSDQPLDIESSSIVKTQKDK